MTEYIEREAVAKLIKSEYIEDLIAEWWEAEFDNIYVINKKELLDIPAADVRPVVRGKWIDDKGNVVPWDEMNTDCPAGSCSCSVCGDWLTASDEYPARGRFCPNCGADMREES